MKKRINIFITVTAVIVAGIVTGCRDYDDPAPYRIYGDGDFEGSTIISISDLKQYYYDLYNQSTIGMSVVITDDVVIKGKVISNDAYGNIYRSMYIQDATGGLEIKIGLTGVYNDWKPGQMIYVKAKGLVLGNYRHMLSLGAASTDARYANGYLDVRHWVDKIIYKGEIVGFEAADTIVIDSPDQLNDSMTGMLLRFNGLRSSYSTWDGNNFPTFLESVVNGANTDYTTYSFLPVIEEWKTYLAELAAYEDDPQNTVRPTQPKSPRPGTLAYPTWAFKNDTDAYYGSALFKFGAGDPSVSQQNLVVRSSGYSRFALDKLPEDGAVVNMTAIYTKYSDAGGGHLTYQLLLNSTRDVEVVR